MNPDADARRGRLAVELLDFSRPPPGYGGAPAGVTSARVLGLGVALGAVLEAAMRAEDRLPPEDRLTLLAQGVAALQAEFLALAPPEMRSRLSATLSLMAAEEAEHLAAARDCAGRA